MESLLSKLKLEHWWHVVTAISAALLGLSLTVPMVGVENATVQLASLGGLLLGIGEWMNHPVQEELVPPEPGRPWGKLTGHPYSPCVAGVLLDIAALACFAYAVYREVQ